MNTNQRLKHLQAQFFPAALIAEKSAIVLFFTPKLPVPSGEEPAGTGIDDKARPNDCATN